MKRVMVFLTTFAFQKAIGISFLILGCKTISISNSGLASLAYIGFGIWLLISKNILWNETRLQNCFLKTKPKSNRKKLNWFQKSMVLIAIVGIILLILFP